MTKRKPKAVRKQEILDAAFTCFSKKGYHGTTMDDIIVECGLSKGAIYWHFKGKREIFIELIEQHIEEDKARMKSLTAQFGISPALLRHAGHFFLERHFGKEKEELMPLFIEFVAESSRDPKIEKKLREIYSEWIELIRQSFDRAKERGIIRDFDARCLAQGVFALVEGLIDLYIVFGEKLEYKKVWDTFTDALLEGMVKGG